MKNLTKKQEEEIQEITIKKLIFSQIALLNKLLYEEKITKEVWRKESGLSKIRAENIYYADNVM